MKKHLLMLSAAMTLAVGANAQSANSLDWNREITQTQLETAMTSMQSILGTATSAHYALRGGKENGSPESHCYQYEYCLNTDNFAGYTVVTHHDFPYAGPADIASTYAMHESFNGAARGAYGSVKNILVPFLRTPAINDMPEVKAVNLLYLDLSAQECADISGPFSYFEDLAGAENITTYNDMKSIYEAIVGDIDNIVACLKNYKNRPDWYKNIMNEIFDSYETSRELKGEKFVESCWRLANSLKLRMALRVVKVEPQLAKKWAEEAVASGVCESENMQQGMYPKVTGFTNPLVQIYNQWNDNRMNASYETLLVQFDHPYAKFLYTKNSMAIANPKTGDAIAKNSRLVGIRAGAHVGEGQSASSNIYIAASTFESDYGYMSNVPLYFVKWAEVDFLRAEGAIRGWEMGGTAKQFYERGIKNASLDEPKDRKWYEDDGVTGYDDYVDEYMQLEAAKPYTQVDPYGDGEDWVSPITIGVKWNDADNNETKLEKIITQKWFALYPNSQEAWAEVRRTGYPRLIPVLNSEEGDGSLKNGALIRRMPWAATDAQQIAIIQSTGLKALGGDDLQATRLWWDVECGNFEDAIQTVNADVEGSSEIYDLSGRRADIIKSGLYIRNGKKFVVK